MSYADAKIAVMAAFRADDKAAQRPREFWVPLTPESTPESIVGSSTASVIGSVDIPIPGVSAATRNPAGNRSSYPLPPYPLLTPPASISSNAGSVVGSVVSAVDPWEDRAEFVLGEHHRRLRPFLQADPDGKPWPSPAARVGKARDKLVRLTTVQFTELSTDVYDELVRRQAAAEAPHGAGAGAGSSTPESGSSPSWRPAPPFLPPEQRFHPKRNDARLKLSTLAPSRFRDLATDVLMELERRFPRFAAEASSPRPESSASMVGAPGAPGREYVLSSTSPRTQAHTSSDSADGRPPDVVRSLLDLAPDLVAELREIIREEVRASMREHATLVPPPPVPTTWGQKLPTPDTTPRSSPHGVLSETVYPAQSLNPAQPPRRAQVWPSPPPRILNQKDTAPETTSSALPPVSLPFRPSRALPIRTEAHPPAEGSATERNAAQEPTSSAKDQQSSLAYPPNDTLLSFRRHSTLSPIPESGPVFRREYAKVVGISGRVYLQHPRDPPDEPQDPLNGLPLKRIASPLSIIASDDHSSESDPSSSEDDTSMGQRKRRVVNNVMKFFVNWLDTRLGVVHCQGGAQHTASGAGTPGGNASQGARSGGTSGKRPLDEPDQGDDAGAESGEEDGGPAQPRKRSKRREDGPEKRKFACPFFKHNPRKYRHQRPCCGPGWDTVHRIKEHLYRKHALPKHMCPRCSEYFDVENELLAHAKAAEPCAIREPEPIDGFSPAQEKRLKSRKKQGPEELTEPAKWRQMYQILFPDVREEEIPSSYDDDVTNGLKGYEDYLRREMPPLVRRWLEKEVERDLNSMEESLKVRVINIVRNLQLALFRNYQKLEGPADGTEASSEAGPSTATKVEDTPAEAAATDGSAMMDLQDPLGILDDPNLVFIEGDDFNFGDLGDFGEGYSMVDVSKVSDSGYRSGSVDMEPPGPSPGGFI